MPRQPAVVLGLDHRRDLPGRPPRPRPRRPRRVVRPPPPLGHCVTCRRSYIGSGINLTIAVSDHDVNTPVFLAREFTGAVEHYGVACPWCLPV